MRHNGPVASRGKRVGERRGRRRPAPSNLLTGALITCCVIAWGYLVYAAIDFGLAARSGETRAWGFMSLAALGAIACLFIGLMLVSTLLERLGVLGGRAEVEGSEPGASKPQGGKRIAR
jgi:hypothetical protein